MRKYVAVILMGLVLFAAGAVFHLDVRNCATHKTIFGDSGDGFFNLWAVEHTVGCLTRGELNFADGRIFWPDNADTFLRSDTMSAPALSFGVIKALTGNSIRAFWFTSIWLSLMGFLAYMFLFGLLLILARRSNPGIPDGVLFLVPLAAYLANFSRARLAFFIHFQNLSVFWLFLLAAGLIGYTCFKWRGYFALAVVSEVILIYSAVYFAIAGLCILGLWGLLMLLAGGGLLQRTIRENWLVIVAGGAIFMVMAVAYAKVPKITYDVSYLQTLAVGWSDMLVSDGGVFRTALSRIAGELHNPESETPAYLGLGVILALVLIGLHHLPAALGGLKRLARNKFFLLAVGLAAFCSIKWGAARPVTCWIGAALIVLLIVKCASAVARRLSTDPVGFVVGFLLLASAIMYGIAFGPWERFHDQPVNPSLWGVMALVPGVANMRAIGRLAIVGHGLLLGALLLYVFTLFAQPTRRTALWSVVLVLMALQGIELAGGKARHLEFDADMITPRPDETAFFAGVQGPAIVFPAYPDMRNAGYMVYFSHFPGLCIMNGYSTHSTPTWDRIANLAAEKGVANEDQILAAEQLGVKYLVFHKSKVGDDRLRELRNSGRQFLFRNDRFLVLMRKTQPSVPASP
jgi:hypothetical protein